MEHSDKPILKRNRAFWSNPVTVTLGAVLLFFASQILGALLVAPFVQYLPSQNYEIVLYIFANLVAMLALLSMAMNVLGFDWERIGVKKFRPRALLQVIPAFVLYFVASTVFTILATKFIPGFKVDQAQDIGFSDVTKPAELIATFVGLVILTPIFEEIIFRGVLFRGLRRRLPFWFAAVLTSLAFATAHLQLNVAVDTFALSLVLCYLVEKSDSVIPGMLLHAVKNTLAFVLLFILK